MNNLNSLAPNSVALMSHFCPDGSCLLRGHNAFFNKTVTENEIYTFLLWLGLTAAGIQVLDPPAEFHKPTETVLVAQNLINK